MKLITSTSTSFNPYEGMAQSGTASNAFQTLQLGDFILPTIDQLNPCTAESPNYFDTFLVSDNDNIEIEKRIYENSKERLLGEYEGKYIALLNGNVIDSDIDFSDLAKRVYEKTNYSATFITLVTKDKSAHRLSPKFKSPKSL